MKERGKADILEQIFPNLSWGNRKDFVSPKVALVVIVQNYHRALFFILLESE